MLNEILQLLKSEARLVLFGKIIVSAGLIILSMLTNHFLIGLFEISHQHLTIMLMCAFLFSLALQLAALISDFQTKNINTKLLLQITHKTFQHMMRLPAGATKKFTSGELTQLFLDFESAIFSVLTCIQTLLFDSMTLILLFMYLAYYNPTISFLYFLLFALFISVKIYIAPTIMRHINAQLAAHGALCSLLNETLLQITKLRSANAEQAAFKQWRQRLLTAKSHEEKFIKLDMMGTMMDYFLPLLLTLLLYGVLYFSGHPSNTDTLLPFIICAGQLAILCEKFSAQLIALTHHLPCIERIQPILKMPIESSSGKLVPDQSRLNIQFQQVSLHDPESKRLILDNITLHIPAGKLIAIIGPSGAGKSTLFNLLLGFSTPTSGSILINNEPITMFNIHALRKHVGAVLQTSSLFPGTIFSNIASNTNTTFDEAWKLADLVGLTEDINRMPMKMHTYISDNASESISGGQRQKILIARALATKPTILLLDEATSALDNHSQALIQANLRKLNITRLVIAHRLSTICDADIIYRMEGGKIIESRPLINQNK
jgi:ABC-type bacteriocin/lantibiotic exporter with double-glycine peptidase domain